MPNSSTLWAPHLRKIGDTFYYYYSQSSFGSSTSAIGVKTTTTPADPSSYVDLGRPIVTSGALATGPRPISYNAIDPALVQTPEGDWWMVWGSFFGGIVVQQLGEDLVSVVGEPTLVAHRRADDNPVEGPAIFYRDGYYYLMVSWDKCCSGADSTYKVAVGRSTSITGPYVDQAGVRMDQGGGRIILDTREAAAGVTPEGLYRAPGGADVYTEDGVDYLVYHAYRPGNTLGIRPMDWYGGWPYFAEPGGGPYDLTDGSHVRLVSEAKAPSAVTADRVAGPAGFGSAVKLNGGSPIGYVDLPDGIVSGLDGDFAISMWVNRGSTQGNDWARIFDFGDSTTNFMFLTPSATASPTGLRLDVRTADGRGTGLPTSGNSVGVPVGWTHIAVTVSGSTAQLWVNGTLARTNTNFTVRPADLGVTRNNWIGRSQFAADAWLNASVDDFNIFDRALSAEDVAALVQAPGGGETVGGGDVAWYRFDEPGGTAVLDSSGSGQDGTAFVPAATGAEIQNPVPGTQCLGTVEVDGVLQPVQVDCEDEDLGQVWRLDEAGDGLYQLASHATGETLCLALENDSRTVGTPAVLAPCSSEDPLQRWFVSDTGHGFLQLTSPSTNLALQIENEAGFIGTAITGGDRGNRPIANLRPPQQWMLQHVDVADVLLDVETQVSTRCVAGRTVVLVSLTNASDVALAAELSTPYGARDVARIDPGRRVSYAFSTRVPSIEAGTVTARVSRLVDGVEQTAEETAAFAATSCS